MSGGPRLVSFLQKGLTHSPERRPGCTGACSTKVTAMEGSQAAASSQGQGKEREDRMSSAAEGPHRNYLARRGFLRNLEAFFP